MPNWTIILHWRVRIQTICSARPFPDEDNDGLSFAGWWTGDSEALDGIIGVYPFMKTLASITLEFLRRFDEKKREKNILDFNDLEHLCLKILIDKDENNNIIPSKVAEHFREFFDEVLVDEYQDSNSVQETIIDLVSRRSLKEANVFMVGDVKQSIYRFRQAKPELFLDKYNKYSLKEGKSGTYTWEYVRIHTI